MFIRGKETNAHCQMLKPFNYLIYLLLSFPVYSPNKADFIRSKHQQLAYVLRSSDTEEELDQQLHSSVRTGNLETSLRLLAQGADPNYFHEVSIKK